MIAIVGRQNVGKSSLLNAMAGRRISIVDPKPGVTRDRVSAVVERDGAAFELVDTAGIGLEREDRFYESVERQIKFAIERADLILFVVDAIEGVTARDKEVARRLRRSGKDVMLVANKSDNPRFDARVPEMGELGFGDAYAVSCAHRRFVGELVEEILRRLPGARGVATPPKIAIVGKRNVGKSTLVNALAGEERVVVNEMPGTTRDAVDVHVRKGKNEYILIDTAGLRKKGRTEDTIEFFSQVRTAEAVGRADAVILMIDVQEKVTEVDKRIAGTIEERKKPCVIVLNKWDLVPKKHAPAEFEEYIDKAMPVLSYAPVMMMSALKGDRIWDVFKVASDLVHQASQQIATADVNRAIRRAQAERSPGTRGTREPKIFYSTQTRTKPPTFVVFVNDPLNFTPDYKRYLENKMRMYLPFKEVPIRLTLKKRTPGKES
ncbi:MAG TPA: ribosome biogenesis GTPase Der [Planctomycetota bacterium]|nr:ribosome biogenesis GTPase Der [Planctomycetota bacterium]